MFSMLFFSGMLGMSQLTYGAAAEVDPTWQGQCVNWVNTMRAREGLPALKRWTDFEVCANQAAKRDTRRETVDWSIGQGIFCDWGPYNARQVTCASETGEDAVEKCVTHMWGEKEHLLVNDEGELECKDGKRLEDCADGYLHMRGGHKGYNIYDRVACGIFPVDNDGHYWINIIYGRGEKVHPNLLKPAGEWTSPDGWERENYQKAGFECGGDKEVHPEELLPADCDARSVRRDQYDGCEGEHEIDYLVATGCVVPTPSPTAEPTAEPTTAPTEAPTSEPTAGPTNEPTSAPTDEPTYAPTDAPTEEPTNAPTLSPISGPAAACAAAKRLTDCKKTPGCIFGRSGPCQLMTTSCGAIGNKKTCKTAEPCRWENGSCVANAATPEPTASPTSPPTEDPAAVCESVGTDGYTCKRTDGCTFGKKGPCHLLTGGCDSLERRECNSSNPCEWSGGQCSDVSSSTTR